MSGTDKTHHSVRVSHLSDADIDRIKKTMQTFAKDRADPTRDAALGAVPAYAESKLLVHVSGYGNVAPYVRAAPGAKKIVDVLGKESFALFGGLLAVGLQAYEDSQRPDLDGAQRLGRASTALLVTAIGVEVPPLGLLLIGLSIAFPQQYDKITAAAFTDRNPAVQGIGWVIAKTASALPTRSEARRALLIDLW